MFLWNYRVRRAAHVDRFPDFFAQPVVGALLGWAFLGEAITPLFLMPSGALIGAGIIARKE